MALTHEEATQALRERNTGTDAQRLLADSTFAEALARIEVKYTREWRASKNEDSQAREFLWTKLRALDAVADEIRAMIGSGLHAARTLELEERDRS